MREPAGVAAPAPEPAREPGAPPPRAPPPRAPPLNAVAQDLPPRGLPTLPREAGAESWPWYSRSPTPYSPVTGTTPPLEILWLSLPDCQMCERAPCASRRRHSRAPRLLPSESLGRQAEYALVDRVHVVDVARGSGQQTRDRGGTTVPGHSDERRVDPPCRRPQPDNARERGQLAHRDDSRVRGPRQQQDCRQRRPVIRRSDHDEPAWWGEPRACLRKYARGGSGAEWHAS